jgi:class 3 adenylate cyclase
VFFWKNGDLNPAIKSRESVDRREPMTNCISKTKKLDWWGEDYEKTGSYFTPLSVVKPCVDNPERLREMTHLEYVLVPKQLAQMATALVLNLDKLLHNSPLPEHLFDVSQPGKTGSTAPVEGGLISTEDLRRKLVAILIADVVGYCRLMNEDEAATISTLTSYKLMMTGLVERWRGRVVDSPGDNLMAEFPSVVDVVQCAVTVQKKFKEMNRGLPENRKMEFRIGINLGDVIDLGNRIYGDRVNIAARLEAIADPGGICISRTVYDQIEDTLPLNYEYLGEKKVKNIPKPVQAYRIMMEREDTHSKNLERKTPDSAEKKKETHISSRIKLIENIAHFFTDFFGVPRFYTRGSP